MMAYFEQKQRQNKRPHPSQHIKLTELPVMGQDVIWNLRGLHFQYAKLEIELHRSIFELEAKYDKTYREIFDQRQKILEKFKGTEEENPLQHFWLIVLQSAGVKHINQEDEEILKHLIDIRSRICMKPKICMIIEFIFEPNKYFANESLTKTYYIKCYPDPNDVVVYDGIDVEHMEGCKIDWLVKSRKDYESDEASFFDYFEMNTDPEDRAQFREEVASGFYLREQIIPKAVYFFTGEINNEESSDDSSSGDESITDTEFDEVQKKAKVPFKQALEEALNELL